MAVGALGALLRLPLGAGLIAGAATGALWVAARYYGRDRVGEILDWGQVEAIALKGATTGPPLSAEQRSDAEAEYAEMLREVAGRLSSYTGSALDLAHSEVRALDRSDWVRANISNFRDLLAPFESLYRESVNPSRIVYPGVAAVGRLAVSAEIGVLLGYLARRVLGQYDISLLGARSSDPGKLYFVEPNILAVQLALGVPRREFRLWLALHEATHAHEFEGHPWVRDYLNAMVHDYVESMVGQAKDAGDSLKSMLGRAADHLWVGGSLIEAMMNPYQRELVSRLQALMCLLEGYSTHVMNSMGRDLLPHFTEIERRVEERSAQRGAAEQLFLRLTGLQMKLDQYRLGSAFVDQVVAARGIDFMNQVWDGAEKLPTEAEVREPERWIERVSSLAPAGGLRSE